MDKTRKFYFLAMLSLLVKPQIGLARHTNLPLYEEPYDIAAGGASLTKSEKIGLMFTNPALLAHGDGFHRWAGLELGLLSGVNSLSAARQFSGSGGQSTADLIDLIFSTPIHFGLSTGLGYTNRNFGFAVVDRVEPDLKADRFGDTGLPEIHLRAESYHAAAISLAESATPWLKFGATVKQLYIGEPDIAIEVTDQEKIASLQNSSALKSQIIHNSGAGLDLGTVIFIQGNYLDWTLAGKVDDLGDTQLAGEGNRKNFKQVNSVGTALTLHSNTDALHLAADFRDISNVYQESLFKRIYAGAKLTLRTYVGLAAGYYQGYPSYGAEIDLVFARLSATAYTREYGDHAGVDPRPIYLVSLSLGY